MKTTPLHNWHTEAGSRFAPFAGFDMPVQYGSAVDEHRLCRRSAGLFDTSHMGRLLVSGEEAGKALSALVTSKILDMKTGEARYSLLLNEQGGVIDDLFIYRLGESAECKDPWFIVVNAGNRDADLAWFSERLPSGVSLEDLSDKTGMVAVQGPGTAQLLDRMAEHYSAENDLFCHKVIVPECSGIVSIKRMSLARLNTGGIAVYAGRTGYTGEDGAELFCSAEKTEPLWKAILAEAEKAKIEAGAIGLAARDSLRFEAGMPLHGHEISQKITPLEALLSWACDFSKDFTGKDALLEQKRAGLKRKLVTINVTGGVPREGYAVLNETGTEIGEVVSGMFCPTTETFSANAYVPPDYSAAGTELNVEIRGISKKAIVIKRPLYVPAYRR